MFQKLDTMTRFAVSTNAIKYLNVGGWLYTCLRTEDTALAQCLGISASRTILGNLTTSGLFFSMPACRKRFIHF
jgi:hypothetical protein